MSRARPVYYKDIWALGPARNLPGCPGRFPQGFMPRVMERWGKGKTSKLMLFSGTFHEPGWITVDIRPEMQPTYVANCEALPFGDESYDLIVLDPPYSKDEARDLYGLPYVRMGTALNEAARVLAPGGHMCLLHRTIYDRWGGASEHFRRLQIVGIVGVFHASCQSSLRALTVWRKREAIEQAGSATTAFLQLNEEGLQLNEGGERR